MKKFKYVILGGGMAAGYAAKEFTERGLKAGELAIVSSDTVVPYERPPLSKGFLAGKEDEAKIRINPEEFYGERGIELKLKTEVAGVDTEKRLLQLRSGEQVGFEKLMVATGAAVRTLEVPGADLEGIFYLRSLDDSKRIRLRSEAAQKAVVIGSGFIGMEVASVLAQKGIQTTMVIREDRIWPKFFTPAMSKNFETYFSERGVQFMKRASVVEIKRDQGLQVVTQDGKGLPCDMLVAGIGVRPAVDVLMDSGIDLGDGIVVNSFLETSEPGVYAAGDAANYEDPLFGVRRRAEHWDNAVSQGQHCARVMAGERKPFVHVPYFFSDVFDLSYEYWGDGTGADEVIERGDLSTSSFSVWWLRDKRLIAAFVMNRPDQERSAAPQWIETKRHLVADELRGDRWPTA